MNPEDLKIGLLQLKRNLERAMPQMQESFDFSKDKPAFQERAAYYQRELIAAKYIIDLIDKRALPLAATTDWKALGMAEHHQSINIPAN